MNCQDFRELIDSYLCDELLTETNHGVLRHLENCANCRGVIEDRRVFRSRLRSTVMNSEELAISEKFKANLYSTLRKNAAPRLPMQSSFLIGGFGWTAVAATVVFAAVIGVWLFQSPKVEISPDIAALNVNKIESSHFQTIALGDHQNCAIKHSLEELPVAIDLSTVQYASLNKGVVSPLKEEFIGCELIESHICKYQRQTFTHLIFKNEGKTMSVLMMDIKDKKPLEKNEIAKLSEQGFHVAHFDIDQTAVFVISDLPEPKNSYAAEILKLPLRRQFSNNKQKAFVSFANFIR